MVLSCGETVMDFIPVETVTGAKGYLPAPGGSPLNTAITVGRLGVEAAFLGKLSTDFFGDEFVARMEENQVSTRYLTRVEAPSTLAFVKRGPSGDAQYAFFTAATADRLLAPTDLPSELPSEVSCLHFGSIALALPPASETITELVLREHGRRVLSFDPNIRPALIDDPAEYRARFERLATSSTILKLSDADLAWLYPEESYEQAVRRTVALGAPVVIVTRGADGVTGVCSDGTVEVAAVEPATGVVDTVGAGDSFQGAVLAGLQRAGKLSPSAVAGISRDELELTLSFAARVASVTCSRAGAEPPWIDELGDR